MKRARRDRVRPVKRQIAIAAALALVIAACGDEASVSPDPTSETTATTEEGTVENDGIADEGDLVQVHYRGTLDDGTEFDSSEGGDPLTFSVGSGQLIAGFDDAVRGLAVGDTVTVSIPPEEAYGVRTEEAVIELPADAAPDGLEEGDQVRFGTGQVGTVLEVGDDTIVIDANHPLAGETLTFEIELVAVSD